HQGGPLPRARAAEPPVRDGRREGGVWRVPRKAEAPVQRPLRGRARTRSTFPASRRGDPIIPGEDSSRGNAMAYETILLDRKAAVAVIRLNRPDKLNAMNSKLKEEVEHALA